MNCVFHGFVVMVMNPALHPQLSNLNLADTTFSIFLMIQTQKEHVLL